MNPNKSLKAFIVYSADLLFLPFTFLVALISKFHARFGAERLPLSYKVWDSFGVAPVRYHYYQPLVKADELPTEIWEQKDPLFGIDFNLKVQLSLLEKFNYQSELAQFPLKKNNEKYLFYHHNGFFEHCDAEIFYSVLRYFKPAKLIEIGAGFSTLLAKSALEINNTEGKRCEHICIEPYENQWLQDIGVDKVIREKVENLPLKTFELLEAGDILFIDSSHVIRTGGDVCYEYLKILPSLKPGVIIHIHDIFLPSEYPREWLVNRRLYWNEQYLLQAFLAFNSEFEVLLALNYLGQNHSQELSEKCPIYAKIGGIPGSFWIRRKI
ncbi:class I SAM-dependent methyltransferase [Ancylothrix sp. C2]|uniref:class I SAM-dependent methyltransferase n=1 Tax=Ancylothrix sp. D3o TaxID=2953691 RepID=UPI0021BAC743|nr:class I SAM-dependent methyltransferase [Ancylothrix sp. D3o]MCT7950025.1 class I SAM-dependent methyltransferase [Ancylothrix sp. D3o]